MFFTSFFYVCSILADSYITYYNKKVNTLNFFRVLAFFSWRFMGIMQKVTHQNQSHYKSLQVTSYVI